MRDEVYDAITETFDPSDVSNAEQLAFDSIQLMRVCARALRAEENHMRMGRDDAGNMFVAIQKVASTLGIAVETGGQVEALHKRLCSESTCVAERFCDEMIQNIKHNVSAAKKRIEIVVAIRRAAMKIEDASRSNDTMRCPAVEIMQRIITEEISESTGH